MKQKIIIEKTVNQTPEEALADRLEPLFGEGYRIVTATTSLALLGEMDVIEGGMMFGVARHVYYVTTIVLEKA